MKNFPMGFWNYCNSEALTPADVKVWKELGLNLSVGPCFAKGGDTKHMTELLDACAQEDVAVVVSDSRIHFAGAVENQAAHEAAFTEAYNDFGKHPAVMGFHVGDEPNTPALCEDAILEHRIHLKLAPELTPHLNFMPYWPDQENTVLKAPSFEAWADNFTKKADLKILCYDCYCQMNPGEEGVDLYFRNLRQYVEVAKVNGAQPWTTLLSIGHFRYRVPNEDDLRWQVNTAVASGMKGLLWFFIYMLKLPFSNYRLPPIDEFGERTETFGRMARVNRHFLTQFGEFFAAAEHLATYHTLKSYGGVPLFCPGVTDDVLLDVTCEHNLPAVLGFFALDGHKHVAVVNNSTTESGLFKLRLSKKSKPIERFNWDHTYSEMRVATGDAFYEETETEQIGGDWLAPGQMKLYRLN